MAGKRQLNLPSELLPEQPPEPQVPDQPAAPNPPAGSFAAGNDEAFVSLQEILRREQEQRNGWRGVPAYEPGDPGSSDGLLPGNPHRRMDPIRQAEQLANLPSWERQQHLTRLENEDPEYMRAVRDHLEALVQSQDRAQTRQRRLNDTERRAAEQIRDYLAQQGRLQAGGEPKQASTNGSLRAHYPDAARQANELMRLNPDQRYAWMQHMRGENPEWAEEVGKWYNTLYQEMQKRERESVRVPIPMVSKAPTVIRTYADLERSLQAKAEQARANAANGSPDQQSLMIFKDGQISAENGRKPHIGDVVVTEDGREVGVITRVRANMTGPWSVDLRAPTGYHLGDIPSS